MKLWIDAAEASTQRVFGMSLIERHLKAARHQKIEISEVIVDCGSAAETQFVLEPRLKAPVRVVRSTGTCGERLAAAAADETVLATDAATLADARLYGYLGGTAGSKVAGGDGADSDAVIARIEPGDVAGIDRAATRLSKAVAAVSPLTQAEFPAFIRKLRRSTPYYLFRIETPEQVRKVERFLFWSNYKGSTDFFTKYIYPPLVWLMVPPLARARVHPNLVTAISIFLTLIAVRSLPRVTGRSAFSAPMA